MLLLSKGMRVSMNKKRKMERILMNQELSNRIYYEITSTCNLKCIHCSELLEQHEVAQMNALNLLKFHKEMKRFGVVNSVVTGGEPALHSDFYYIVEELAKIGQVLITSNGLLINRLHIAELMIKYPNIRLQLSMDGVNKEVFESIRGKNTYEVFMRLLYYLIERGLAKQTNLSMTIMQKNMHQIKAIIDFAYENGIGVVHFPALLPVGASRKRWDEIAPEVMTQIEIEEFIGSKMTENAYASIISSNRIEQMLTKLTLRGNCDCLNNITLKVVPQGEILLCPASSNLEHSIGNIIDENITDNIMSCLESKKTQFIELINTELEHCKHCNVEQYCHSRFCANCSLLAKPELKYSQYYCDIIKHHLKSAVKEIGEEYVC